MLAACLGLFTFIENWVYFTLQHNDTIVVILCLYGIDAHQKKKYTKHRKNEHWGQLADQAWDDISMSPIFQLTNFHVKSSEKKRHFKKVCTNVCVSKFIEFDDSILTVAEFEWVSVYSRFQPDFIFVYFNLSWLNTIILCSELKLWVSLLICWRWEHSKK